MSKIAKIKMLALLLILSGCAAKEVRGCRDGEGYSLGYQDAMYGFPQNYAQDREKACVGIGAKLDDKKYAQGFSSGLKKFCRTEYGYEFGLQGQLYQRTCPKTSESKFLSGYLNGRKKYLNEEIKDRQGLIESINSDLKSKEKRSLASEITKLKSRREVVASELGRLTKELDDLAK